MRSKIKNIAKKFISAAIKQPNQKKEEFIAIDLQLTKIYNQILPETLQYQGNPLRLWNHDCLFFLHIPKTGGSTLFFWLAGFFHPLQICPERYTNLQQFKEDQLLQYKFYAPHVTFRDYQNLPHQKKSLITLLRNPLDRVLSHYYFHRSHKISADENYPGNPICLAKIYTLSDYIQSKGEVQNCYDNIYLRTLTDTLLGPDNIDPLLDKDCNQLIELAKQRLDSFDVVGILEEFDLSAKLIAHKFNLPLDKDIIPQNVQQVNMEANPDVFEKVEKEPLNDELMALLTHCTRYDKIIYDYAKELFAKQVQQYLGHEVRSTELI